ncbi:MAG: hypothetical protein QOH70_2091 [Blastocatellia bacterium]|nr:hypothetical protein [Blastocatellia bacterium]
MGDALVSLGGREYVFRETEKVERSRSEPQPTIAPWQRQRELSVAEGRIEIYCLPLREGVSECRHAAEAKTAYAADELFHPALLDCVIDDPPNNEDDAKQEQQVSSPLNELADAVADRLIVAPKDAPAWRLGQCRKREQQQRSDDDERRRKSVNQPANLKQALRDSSGPRLRQQLVINVHVGNAIVKPISHVKSILTSHVF